MQKKAITLILLLLIGLSSLPAFSQDIAELYFVKSSIEMGAGYNMFTELRLNLPDNRLSSFVLELTYNSMVIQPHSGIGVNGVTMDPTQLSIAVNANSLGRYIITGTYNQTPGPGTGLPFLTIHWKCVGSGAQILKLAVTKFAGPGQEALPLANSNLSLSTTIGGGGSGDVNVDFKVDINDALLIAMFAAGRVDSDLGYGGPADVNFDDKVDIIDALLIARYVAKLVSSLPVPPVYGH